MSKWYFRPSNLEGRPGNRLFWTTLLAWGLLLAAPVHAELDPVRMQLQWKHQFEFAGFYAAKEKGFYEEVGLDVELLEFDQNTDLVGDVLSGKVDFSLGYSTLIADYLNEAPVVLLANLLKRSPIAIVAQPNIASPADLAGKTIMGMMDTEGKAALLMMLRASGVSPKQIKHVPPTFNVDAFVDGKVDAMVVFTSNEIFELEQRNKAFRLFDPSLYGAEHYDGNLFTSRKQLQKHPLRVQRFLTATLRGWRYAMSHPDEVVQLIYEKYNTQKKSLAALQFEAQQISTLMMANVSPIGSIDPLRLRMIGANYIATGLVPEDKPLVFTDFIYRLPASRLHLNPAERAYLKDKKSIRYCIDPDWMPFEQIEQGRHVGMSADYFAIFSTFLDTPLKLIPTRSWAQSLHFAQSRQCDLLSLAMDTPERRSYLNFTTPYLSFPLAVATRNNTVFIPDIESIIDKPLGVVEGNAFAERLRQRYPSINLTKVANLRAGMNQVAKGRLFGFIGSLATIGYVLQNDYIGELKIAGKFAEHWELGIAVRNDDPMLLSVMQKAVSNLTTEDRQTISNTWLPVTIKEGVDYHLVLTMVAVALMILAVLAYLQYVQNRFVSKLKVANEEIEFKNTQLKQLSITDPLTGLYNRLKLDEILQHEYNQFQRYGTPFSVMILDLDHFKQVNDDHGHLTGDQVLITLTQRLRDDIRKTDQIGRWGGEEFLIVCPNTPLDQAGILAEKLAVRVRESSLPERISMSVSIGVAQIEPGLNPDQLVEQADSALYQAKNAGRNRVIRHSMRKT